MSFFQRLVRFFRPDPQDRFLALARSLVAATSGIELVSEDRVDFSLVVRVGRTGQEATFYLENTFLECRGLPPSQVEARIARVLRGLAEGQGLGELSQDAAMERLVPVVRAMSVFHAVFTAGRMVCRPFQPYLLEGLVLDLPDSMQYLMHDRLAAWNVSPAEAFRIARDRLSETVDQIEPYLKAGTSTPLWWVANDDDYEASRLLIPGWLDAFADRVQGAPVVVVPDRRTVIVGGLENEGHLARLLDLANELFLASPRRLSPVPYTVDGAGGIRVLRLPDDHPLAARVKGAERALGAVEYQYQKEFLDEQHGKEGVDLHVASYKVMRQPDGQEYSLTYWHLGIEALIPRAEKIAMGIPDARQPKGIRTRVLTWDQVMRALGECLSEDPTFQPVRYRTMREPNGNELAALEACLQ